MKAGRWLFDKPCALHSFLFQAPGECVQMRLKITRGDSK